MCVVVRLAIALATQARTVLLTRVKVGEGASMRIKYEKPRRDDAAAAAAGDCLHTGAGVLDDRSNIGELCQCSAVQCSLVLGGAYYDIGAQ